MNVKMTKQELKSVSSVLDQFDDVVDFTIVRGPLATGGHTLEIVFETTIKGLTGLFKVDLTENE